MQMLTTAIQLSARQATRMEWQCENAFRNRSGSISTLAFHIRWMLSITLMMLISGIFEYAIADIVGQTLFGKFAQWWHFLCTLAESPLNIRISFGRIRLRNNYLMRCNSDREGIGTTELVSFVRTICANVCRKSNYTIDERTTLCRTLHGGNGICANKYACLFVDYFVI